MNRKKPKVEITRRAPGKVLPVPQPRPIEADHPGRMILREAVQALSTPPVLETAPALNAAPVSDAAAAPDGPTPPPEAPPVLETAPALNAAPASETDAKMLSGVVILPEMNGESRIPNYIAFGLPGVLGPISFVIWHRLYLLSHGFRKTRCKITTKRLAESVGLKERSINRYVNELESRRLIKRHYSQGKDGQEGNEYEVFLPYTPATLAAAVTNAPPVLETAPASKTDMNNNNKQTKRTGRPLRERYASLAAGTIAADTAAPASVRLSTLRSRALGQGIGWDEVIAREVLGI